MAIKKDARTIELEKVLGLAATLRSNFESCTVKMWWGWKHPELDIKIVNLFGVRIYADNVCVNSIFLRDERTSLNKKLTIQHRQISAFNEIAKGKK